MINGTRGGTRTPTPVTVPDPKSGASTNSATLAYESEPNKIRVYLTAFNIPFSLFMLHSLSFRILKGGRHIQSHWPQKYS